MQWCDTFLKATLTSVNSDIDAIDKKILKLLEERAAKTILQVSLEDRVQSLQSQRTAEAVRFRAFKAAYESKLAAIQGRVKDAEAGAAAAQEFKDKLSILLSKVAAEIETLKTQARELQLDVGADSVEACRIGCNCNFLRAYFEREKCTCLQEKVQKATLEFQFANRVSDTEKAKEKTQEIERSSRNVQESEQIIQKLQSHSTQMERGAQAAWDFLRRNAVGGEQPAHAKRFCVRTSVANLAVWGGGENRSLEKPEQKNLEMHEEAESYKSQIEQKLLTGPVRGSP